jgi:hypothetical protein
VDQVAREAIVDLCEVLEIELTPERRAQLEAMGAEELVALRARIKAARAWAV